MKKIILTACLIGMNISSFANAVTQLDECVPESCIHSSYFYSGIGLGPLPVPALTLGLEKRTVLGEKEDLDTGITLATLLRWNLIRANLNGLLYFRQNPCSQYYLGLGATGGIPFGFDDIQEIGPFVSPSFLIGKEFINSEGNKRFFQAEVLYPPYLTSQGDFVHFPFITLKYGFAF